jgi:proline iminopeptidase
MSTSTDIRSVDLGAGRRATYEVIGEGEPALMLPGGPGLAAGYMRSTAELFSDTWRSYLIDPHGSGGSTPPADPAQYSPAGHVEFYEQVREALGLPALTVVGHSFGATTTITYAALRTQAVTRAIALAPLGVGTETDEAEGGEAAAEMERALSRHAGSEWYPSALAAWSTWTERVLAADSPDTIDELFRDALPLYFAHPDEPRIAAAIDALRPAMRGDLAAAKAWESGLYQTIDLRPLLPRISSPTLIVAGELDLICGPAQAEPLAAGIPGATLRLIADCGHFMATEQPQALRRIVDEWLA